MVTDNNIIIITIIIIVIVIISFMQGIYTYIPEIDYVPREYSVAADLLLLFMVLISLVSVLNLLYYYYWYHLCFYIPHALYFYCKVFIFQNLLGFFFNHIYVS